jgi:dienelactone hydrolase
MRTLILFLLAVVATPIFGQNDHPDFEQLASHFDYPRQVPFGLQQYGVEMRDSALLIDLEYIGFGEHRVPAYLIVPKGDGPFPAVIWGHWMMKGSPMRNRQEFLQEALVLAKSGVMSLLIDTPMVRPNYTEKDPKEDPLDWAMQSSDDERQYVVDLRRGLDLLLTRRGVDKNHIGYVGHSFSAHAGMMFVAVEKRVTAAVLMASGYADEEDVRAATSGEMADWKKAVGEEQVNEYFHNYSWDDPANFLAHTDGKSIFLQFATRDAISKQQAQKYLDALSARDKKMEFYETSHALNPAARLDRDRWLQQKLRFKKLDEPALNAIPQLK